MKQLTKKFSIGLLVMFLLLSYGVSFASSNSSISPYAYYDDGIIYFTKSKSITSVYDGTFMAIEFSATSSSNTSEPVTISVYIDNRNKTETFTAYTDGKNYKFDYIYLDPANGSSVRITFSSSSSNQISARVKSYSW